LVPHNSPLAISDFQVCVRTNVLTHNGDEDKEAWNTCCDLPFPMPITPKAMKRTTCQGILQDLRR
jgi:hypothetical protein